MPHPTLRMTRGDALERVGRVVASVASGALKSYWAAGKGGRDPRAPLPFTGANQADCSGFVAWACGYDRIQSESVSTGVILADGLVPGGLFDLVPQAERVRPGDVLVYGPHDEDGEPKMGHTAFITEVSPAFVRGGPLWWANLRMAHSSPSNARKFGSGHALAVTDAVIFRRLGYVMRYTGWLPDPERRPDGELAGLGVAAAVLLAGAL